FTSRRRHTRCYRDWSSDVCSSDLLQPNAAPLYLARGVLYVQLGQYDNAEADLDKAHEIDPRESLSSAALAVAAVQENDFGRALTTVNDKLKLHPQAPVLLSLAAELPMQNVPN